MGNNNQTRRLNKQIVNGQINMYMVNLFCDLFHFCCPFHSLIPFFHMKCSYARIPASTLVDGQSIAMPLSPQITNTNSYALALFVLITLCRFHRCCVEFPLNFIPWIMQTNISHSVLSYFSPTNATLSLHLVNCLAKK